MDDFPKIQCTNCKAIIQSQYSGHWVSCPCFRNELNNMGIYIDSTPEYTRIGGSNYIRVDDDDTRKD